MELCVQLDFLEDQSELALLKRELVAARAETANVRKGAFARLADLGKFCLQLQQEQEALKKQLEMVARSK
jgi:hypothetical protein